MKPAAPISKLGFVPERRARTRLGRLAEHFAAVLALPAMLAVALAALFATQLSMASSVGVETTTGVRPGSSEVQRFPTATYIVSGITERGDTSAPIELRSSAELYEKCGARTSTSNVYDDLVTFFSVLGTWDLGGRVLLNRVVGAGATVGTLTFKDRSGGAGLDTVRIDAKNAGDWSNQITIEIADGSLANTFRVIVRLNGEQVQTFNDQASPAAFVTAAASSAYISAANLGSVTAAPANNPRVLAATALSQGTADLGTANAAAHVTALDRTTIEYGGGLVAIPGFDAATIGAGVIAHCAANKRTGVVAPAAGTSVANAKLAAAGLRTTAGSDDVGLFYPHIIVSDGAGSQRTISPCGYIAACRSRALQTEGPHRAGAGELAVSPYILGVEVALTKAQINDLVDDRVNSIRLIAGTVRTYGWRTLSTDEANYLWLSAREVLNYVAHAAEPSLEQFVFRPIDPKGHLFTQMLGVLTGIVDPIREAGGLFSRFDVEGNQIDPGYVIDVGPAVNTQQTIAAGEARANIALRVSPVGELIKLTVTKVSHDTAL